MSWKYTHFIKQNIAPTGTKRIVVYDADGKEVTSVALGGLKPPKSQPLYSFGLVSDIHLYDESVSWVDWAPNTKFDNALSYMEERGCVMCIVCGDLTQTGYYSQDTSGNYYLDESQLIFYRDICEKHSIPVYELAGNHECYYSRPIIDNLDRWEQHTGKRELAYTITQGNDLFIFLGQPEQHAVMSDDALNWVIQLLQDNANKRCFVFVHSYMEEDSGDAGDHRENSIFEYWGDTKTNIFLNAVREHENAILFHGHSHMKFECQAKDALYADAANYTEKNGFKSVHIPSLSKPRDIVDGATPEIGSESQGYIVDVYNNFIVLNGMDLIEKKPVPLGVYKIDT